MRFRFPWTGAAVVVAIALLPLKTGGCGKSACIKAQKGVCPSPEAAMSFFESQCGGPVQSVDGEGTFDGQLCCYPVTDLPDNFVGGCPVEPGVGGFGVGGGFAMGGFGGVAGAGGVGGGPCVMCAEQLTDPQTFDPLCPGAAEMWDGLMFCGCTACEAVCAPNLCSSVMVDQPCADCLQAACTPELDDCSNN